MSIPGILIPFGYATSDAEPRLHELMSNPSTLLLDIRYRPISRYRPQWNKSRLQAQWGKRYKHCRTLGNINYKDRSLPIVLLDPEPTITIVAQHLEGGNNIIVMCACKSYDECHRKPVIEQVEQRRVDLKEHLEQWQASLPRCPECGDVLTRDAWGYPCIVEGQEVCETCMIVYELFHTHVQEVEI